MKNPFEVYSSFKSGRKSRPLDWEESTALSSKSVEEVHDTNRVIPKLGWLKAGLMLIFLVMIFRVFYLQVVKGQEFRLLSENNRIRRQTLLAPRGLIYDRNGAVLAQNTASFNLIAVPFDLPKVDLESEIKNLALTFNLTESEVNEKLINLNRQSVEPILIKQDLTPQESILFETKSNEFIGFSIQKIPIREYIDPLIFSHTLGYTGLINAEELKQVDTEKYDNVDFIGKSGIELKYESFFHGVNGQKLVEVDATGKLQKTLGEQAALPGNTAILNIDKDLQKNIYQNFTKGNPNRKGAAVAMNPKTGEILAFLSLPGFDNNLFAHGIKQAEYSALLSNKNLPLFNRATAGTYPPGSTVKPMVGLAALEEKLVTENTVIVDRGVLVIPNQFDASISYNFYGWNRAGLGPMTVKSAIAESSDIYFYTVAGGHPNSPIKGLGAEKLAEYYRKFNLGKPTGIDIDGEKGGVVADPAWKAEYFKNDAILSKWYLGNTYHIGIGQGDMLTTPLQVAEWTAAIANNGVGMKPQILKQIKDRNGKVIFEKKSEVIIEKFASDQNLKIVQEGMRQTILAGSGRQLTSLGITSAGKTGTSQFDGSDPTRTHAWFTAYAPFENPEIVITVLVEAGGEGHAAAVPVVKEALKWWEENRYNK